MSYDPNQDANSGYGNPPYGMPPQEFYGPPQGPYGYPPQAPYGVPPYQQPSYGYAAPAAVPLPLGEAIRQLPSQYIRVLTKPSVMTFAEEQGKAAWNIVWVQVLFLAATVIIPILLIAILISLLRGAMLSSNSSSPTAPILVLFAGFFVLYAILLVVLVSAGFFAGTGIQYLIARAFGGQGTFLVHSYSSLLHQVPMTAVVLIAGVVLGFIPILNLLVFLLFLAAGIYAIVLDIFMLMAVHRLSGGRATLVYFTPVIVVLLLSCVFASLGALLRPH